MFSGLFSNMSNKSMSILVILIAVALIFLFTTANSSRKKKNEAKSITDVLSKNIRIPIEEVEKNWFVDDSSPVYGYKLHDGPGCYALTFYEKKPETSDELDEYDEVFIGASPKACAHAIAQCKGRGNKDVFSAVRNGKSVFVCFFMCDEEELESKKSELIEEYGAANSFNKHEKQSKGRKKHK